MNQLTKVFENQDLTIIEVDGDFQFLLKDVCEILEIGNHRHVKTRLEDDVVSNYPIQDRLGRTQQATFVNEDGLYDVILDSRKPEAKRFRKWITSEVLPSIRKDGGYIATDENDDDESIMAKAILIANKTIDKKNKELELQKQLLDEQRPKVLFAESVEASQTSILVRELAVLLKQNGVDIGERRLFDWLRTNGFLVKRFGSDRNTPTQRSMDMGLFEIKETPINHNSGLISISKTTKVTGKGQVYFINKFLKGGPLNA